MIPAEHQIIMLFFVQLVFQLSFCRFSNRVLDSHVFPRFSISNKTQSFLETGISLTPKKVPISSTPFMVKIANGEGFSQEDKEIGEILQKRTE